MTVETEDGLGDEGRPESVKMRCSRACGSSVELFDSTADQAGNTVTFKPADTALQVAGAYTLSVWFEETRSALLETLMQCDQRLPPVLQTFGVSAAAALRLRIREEMGRLQAEETKAKKEQVRCFYASALSVERWQQSRV